MLVNAASHAAPAFWQGLMLIGLAIWAPMMLCGDPLKSRKGAWIFIAAWVFGTSALTYKLFG